MGESVAIDVLEREHEVIRKAAAGMEALAARLESGSSLDVNLLTGLVEFLRVYGRGCHQKKEEDLLFPALARRGVPSVGKPLGSLTFEHLKEWAAVGALAGAIRAYSAGEQGAPARVIGLLREMAGFYADHAWNESNLLFPYAARVLTPSDQAELLVQFEIVDREIGKDVVERLVRFGEKLAKEAA